MNFLAHIYLSGDDEQVRIGNFMADSIKGKKYRKYPQRIQNGIILHRAIDYYTDTHPIFMESMQRLFPKYGHYSGIIVDIIYDHFLASNWSDYSSIPLEKYTEEFYRLLEKNHDILPEKVKYFMPYMIQDNWLLSYAHLEGIEQVLTGLNKRTGSKSNMHEAIKELKQFYPLFENEFKLFFNELMDFSKNKLNEIQKKEKGRSQ